MELLRARFCEWTPVGIDALALASHGTSADIPVAEPRLAVGRANGAVELWDTTTWHLRSSSPGCANRSIRGFVWVFSAVDEPPLRLFSAGLKGEIIEWDIATLEPRFSVASGGGAVWAICGDSRRLFCACDDGSVRVFSVEGGNTEITYSRRLAVGRHRLLSAVTFGTMDIFVGGSDSCITKWSLKTSTCEAKMKLQKGENAETLIWTLARLGDHGIASGDSLGMVQVWDPVVCVVLHRFAQHQADVLSLASVADGRVLLSAGVDAKISTFACEPGPEERWVFWNAEFQHTHDVRALDVDEVADSGGLCISGGVAGTMLVHRLKIPNKGQSLGIKKRKREHSDFPLGCSAFLPTVQTASVAQECRLVLCQRDAHLELWYLQSPKDPMPAAPEGVPAQVGMVSVGATAVPEPQLLVRVALSGADGEYLAASAITPDGRFFAASDLSGTRLFRLGLEELEVRCEKRLPTAVREAAARKLMFCGKGLLAVAAWRTCEVRLLDLAGLSIVATFEEHRAPVCDLAAALEWLASADVVGAVHIFNLDSLQHHARVPVGSSDGFPTALSFDSHGKHLIVVLSTHAVLVFDVEAQALAAGLPSPLHIPRRALPHHERVCGVAPLPGSGHRLLLWGHAFLLALDLRRRGNASAATEEVGGFTAAPVWRKYSKVRFHHILGLWSLDAARWGGRVLTDHYMSEGSTKRGRVDVQAMVLAVEVTPEAAESALPQAFERKAFQTNS